MVTLTEVEDEHFQATQAGPDVDDDDFTDTGLYILCAYDVPLNEHLLTSTRFRDLQRL